MCRRLGCSEEEQAVPVGAAADLEADKGQSESEGRPTHTETELAQATEDVSDLLARESLSQEELEQLGAQFAENWEKMMDDLVAQYGSGELARCGEEGPVVTALVRRVSDQRDASRKPGCI